MLILTTTDTLKLVTESTGNIDVYASYVDLTSATAPAPGRSSANITTATTSTILAAPAASTTRQVKALTITNVAGTSNAVQVIYDADGTQRHLTTTLTLGAGEQITLDGDVLRVLDSHGRERHASTELTNPVGVVYDLYKVGSATEAAGVYYGFAKDSGFPGAWAPGTPGVNGWWTDARTASNAANPAGASQCGSPVIPGPTSGTLYMQVPQVSVSTNGIYEIADLLWYNTGLTVTTTTAQAIAMPGSSVASRDLNGSTNGEGVMAGIYVTTATTNASAITNMTLNYTNSDGTAGQTGTITSFPATAVVGTFVPFQLASGDRGVRSIQGVTLGTSLAAGAVSLVMYRKLSSVFITSANFGTVDPDKIGTKIWPGTALWTMWRGVSTSGANATGSVRVVER